MWRKKKWIIIGVLAAVIILTAGIVGAAVINAQTPSPSPTPTPTTTNPQKALADRVAAILGTDPAKTESAFTQAQKDLQNEALTNRLNSLVQQGKLTRQQADQYQQWWESRPNVPAPLGPQGHMGFRGGFKGMPGFGKIAPSPSPSATPSSS